jgi:O-antigen/teichoic acid export membrane protein
VSASNSDPPIVSSGEAGFAGVALRGTAWAVGQLLLNKLAMVIATWVIARCLTASEFAIAAVALTVGKFLCFLPPLNMGDVLIARKESSAQLRLPASRIAVAAGLLVALITIVSAPLVAREFDSYPFGLLMALVTVSGLRSIGESFQVRPLADMRVAFRNRAIAMIDGVTQFICTCLSVMLALLGAGAWSVVAPSFVLVFGKAAAYRVASPIQSEASPEDLSLPADRRGLLSAFAAAAGAQYLHSLVDTAPILLLGRLSSADETGYFALAVGLSSQASSLVASQVSSVLQPVFRGLGHDPERQARGFLRAISTLSAIMIPVCLLQALFGSALFRLFFDDRWQPAAPVFAAQSILEAAFFAAAPTMSILKAQGRFKTFLTWQLAHLAVSAVVVAAAAWYGGAFWVASAGAVLWFVSLPIAVRIAIKSAGFGTFRAVLPFAAPWATALPVALVGWLFMQPLADLGRMGDLVSLFVLAPILVIAMLYLTRWSQPAAFTELNSIAGSVALRAVNLLRRGS